MSKFTVNKDDAKISSVNRTIRMKPEHYDKMSFNKIIDQCIEYALDNLSESKQ